MNPSESSSRETLTRQQRNMALAEPIARLSLDRRVIFKDDPSIAERLDVQYLALSAIDFVMERSAIESGAAPEEIVEHVAGEAARMKPTLTEAQARKVGQVVLDHLSNAREGHKAFRVEYYDADRSGFSFQDFRLLALSTADDGSPRFKLARGAQTLTLAMLDVAPEFAQEAEERPTLQPHYRLYGWLLANGRRCPLKKAPADELVRSLRDAFPADLANALVALWSEGQRFPQESLGLAQLRGERGGRRRSRCCLSHYPVAG